MSTLAQVHSSRFCHDVSQWLRCSSRLQKVWHQCNDTAQLSVLYLLVPMHVGYQYWLFKTLLFYCFIRAIHYLPSTRTLWLAAASPATSGTRDLQKCNNFRKKTFSGLCGRVCQHNMYVNIIIIYIRIRRNLSCAIIMIGIIANQYRHNSTSWCIA